MRLSRATMVLAVSCIPLTGCAKSAPPPGKAVTVESVCNEADGSRVRLTGYIRYRRQMMSFCSTFGGHKTCDMSLYTTAEPPADWDPLKPKGPDPVTASLSVPVGGSPGEMDEIPEKFTASDIHVHLFKDGVGPDGAHVTVDGKLSVIPGSTPKQCFVNVDWAVPAS